MITAKLGGLDLEVVGDKPNNMPNWLWDFEARPISEDDKDNLKSYERISKRGFKGSLYKTDEFINQHPFGTVPAGSVFNARLHKGVRVSKASEVRGDAGGGEGVR